MLGLFPMRRRRAELAQVLGADVTQAPGWEAWLAESRSTRELHATCPHAGWLVYAAYFEGVAQDRLLDGAIAVGALAAERDPRAPVAAALIHELRARDWDELARVIVGLERAHRLTPLVIDLLPGQLCLALSAHFTDRQALRERLEDAPPPELGPFRSRPDGAAPGAEVEAWVAAGYVATLEAPFFRQENLKESVAIRAAAAAALLRGSFAGFDAEALALLRGIYWS